MKNTSNQSSISPQRALRLIFGLLKGSAKSVGHPATIPVRKITLFFISFCLLQGLFIKESPASTKATPFSQDKTLVIGKTSNNPKKHFNYLKPIVDYAVSKMKDLGIQEGKVVLAKDNAQLIRYLKQGKIDWITETPFSAIQFQEKAGAEFLVRRWKKGVAEYHTIFIARKDSSIRSLQDLKGKTIAFEDPGSTSAFAIPYYYMRKEGLSLVQLDTPREKPMAGKVGYIFAGQEVNMSTWLHKRLIHAAAFSNLDWIKKDHMPPAFKKDFSIFKRTISFPRALELVRKDLDPKIKKRLKILLIRAHKDPTAKNALHDYQRTSKFDELDQTAKSSLKEIRNIADFLSLEKD